MIMEKRRHCAGRKTTMMYGDNKIYQLSSSKIRNNPKECLYSPARNNDREASKYNNQQGIHNHCTCQRNSSVSCRTRGGLVALAWGGGHYFPVKTSANLEYIPTPNTCIHAEEASGDMHLLPRGCGVDNDLTADGQNELDARSRRRSRLLALSARRHCIINPGRFLMGGPSAARISDRFMVPLQYWSPLMASLALYNTSKESSFQGVGGIWRKSNCSAKQFGCKQQSERVFTLMGNE